MTYVLILLLAQGGRLSLDDDVRKHVPEVPDFGKTITVRHLIHHTSGLHEELSVQALMGIASIAGLPDSRAIVWVEPPLLLRPVSSPAGVLFRSPVFVNDAEQLASSERL